MSFEVDTSKISCLELKELLSDEKEKETLLIVDMRAFIDFNRSHINTAINICVPKTLLKRKGLNLSLVESGAFRKVDCDLFKQRANKKIIMYDHRGEESENGGAFSKIADALLKENIIKSVHWLSGGMNEFVDQFADMVTIMRPAPEFKISDASSAPFIKGGLVRITEYLFLGGSEASEDYDELTKHGIKYIINTATEIPNSFEDHGIKYIHFDLVDIPSQKICIDKVLLPSFRFIDMARQNDSNVLVHCRGGRSRSAAVVIAYLMKKNKWSLQEAYNYVQAKSPIVSPNLGFIGQLLEFESQLKNKKIHSPQMSPTLSGSVFSPNTVTLSS